LSHNGDGGLSEIDAVPKQSREFALAHPERRSRYYEQRTFWMSRVIKPRIYVLFQSE
jgi:hypothetical protein